MTTITTTAIDVAHDLNMANDPEWDALTDAGDDEGQAALVAHWEARLTAAAERLDVDVAFLQAGSPESHEWTRGLDEDGIEAAAELAARLWDEAR